ncbi:MAG: right-handed parallel beta-helix repeat-containing protein [Planctomycetota bacterium]
MRCVLAGLIPLFAVLPGLAAEAPTWVKIGDTVYGAKPDECGPIGGGNGYRNVVTKGDYTVEDLDGLLAALEKAKAGQVVFIPGERTIDLTARIYIEELVLEIPEGVTLAGNRGHKGSKGAQLTSDALKTPVMIRPTGPDVRVTGLRLRGPNPKRYIEHHRRSFGRGGKGRTYYYKLPTSNGIRTDHSRLEVDNCEISGWSHAGVDLRKGDGHKVHHCYIHHCQYQGLGYGVCHNVASSVIERNLFDRNRHSIAGTGRPGCGYVARHNVELGVSLSHCFDMHGGRDRKDGTNIAGTSIEVHNNTFRAPQTPVVIRGVPQETCLVHHNWFVKHRSAERAVRAGAKTTVKDNACGPKPKAAK